MQGVLNWKKCKKCGKPFDIDTSKDVCPECRRKKKEVKNDRRNKSLKNIN